MGDKELGSFLVLAKRTNTRYAKSAGISLEEKREMNSLRNMDDETYKFILAPLLAHLLSQLVVNNDKVSSSCQCWFRRLFLQSVPHTQKYVENRKFKAK